MFLGLIFPFLLSHITIQIFSPSSTSTVSTFSLKNPQSSIIDTDTLNILHLTSDSDPFSSYSCHLSLLEELNPRRSSPTSFPPSLPNLLAFPSSTTLASILSSTLESLSDLGYDDFTLNHGFETHQVEECMVLEGGEGFAPRTCSLPT